MRSASDYEADPGEERVMATSHPNAAISDTFGDASDGVMPTSAFVIPAASRTNALANKAKLLAQSCRRLSTLPTDLQGLD